jgi:transcriptional regulator with XRE-family HTH domain
MTTTTSTSVRPDMLRNIDQSTTSASTVILELGNSYLLIENITPIEDNATHDGGTLISKPKVKFAESANLLKNRSISAICSINTFPEVINRLTQCSQLSNQLVEAQPHLEAIQWIKKITGFSQTRLGQLIGVTRQTIDEWKKKGTPISGPNRQRLFAVREVLERAASRYKTRELLVAWLDTPAGADGRTPAQLLAENEINRARLLAMSSPSPQLVPPPAWVNRPIPESFRKGSEQRQEALPPNPDSELDALFGNED